MSLAWKYFPRAHFWPRECVSWIRLDWVRSLPETPQRRRPLFPHIDAAIVVVGADPPISGEELALGRGGRKHVHDLI